MTGSLSNLALSLLAIGALTGCLVTTPDLAQNSSGLSPEHQRVVQQAVEKISQFCTVGQYRDPFSVTKEKADFQGVKITQRVEIRRIYISNANWYKLAMVTRGVFDHAFYNPVTQQLVCGELGWQRIPDLASTSFVEITPGTRKAISRPIDTGPVNERPSAQVSTVEPVQASPSKAEDAIPAKADSAPVAQPTRNTRQKRGKATAPARKP